MKKKDFDDRLQNDLFPEMPASFESGLKKTMEQAGVRSGKRPTATGVFAGAISLLAAAACLVIVLIGVMGGGRSDKSNAAAPGEATSTPQMAQPTPVPMDQPTPIPMAQPTPGEWKGDTKVIALSESFDFENREKYEALYQGILRYLQNKGETEPKELWLCAIKPRVAGNNAVDGYYVLARHAFDRNEGPELYCVQENGDVLWATEGSGQGPNHAVHPLEDSYMELDQRHFLYGTEPMIAEPGVPHVKRGAVVGKEKGTDIEFSMAASIIEVQSRLSAADSVYPGAARECFLVTVPAGSWDAVMEAHTLRFETEEGPVDVDMETELPTVGTVQNTVTPQPTPIAEVQGVEYWLSQNQPLIRDFTDDWYGEAAVQQYAEAVRRALLVSGEHIHDELWICGVASDAEHTDGTPPDSVYVLALNVGDGEPSPELFYYENGRILWMTQGADTERINVVYHHGNTIAFGKSPAFDNRPLAMTSGKIVLGNGGSDDIIPALTLEEIQTRITGGPYYYSARECYLWMDGEELEVKHGTFTAEVDGKSKTFPLNKVNVLTPQAVPAMAVKSEGTVYPGRVTHMVHSLNEDGVAADGTPLIETMSNGLLFKTTYTWQRPLNILTASDQVSVAGVDVYSDTFEKLHSDAEISFLDDLDPGTYYLCFRTTVLGPYSEKTGRYTYQTDYTIYKVDLK